LSPPSLEYSIYLPSHSILTSSFVSHACTVRTAGLLDLAWKYLEKAHTGRLAAQSPSVTLEDIDRMEVQIKSIFTTGFWSPNVGSKNTVPIFIVGMMRYYGPDSVHY
jgi:hypothetical protein